MIEILPWDVVLPNREKAAAPLGHLSPLTSEYDPSTGRIGFATPLPAGWAAWLAGLPASVLSDDPDNQRFFYARIWQEPPSGGGVDEAIGAGVVLPDTGLSLTFIGNGIPGDYWHAALRPDTPELIVPWALQDAAGDAPAGPRRFYAPLGLITWSLVAGNVVGTVADCRNRFRRLCHINSCCTYPVGDGRSSFGEFNDIQAAVDALPAEGGEICLLPGRHEGLVNLIDRRNIRIHGCGPRTIVTAPPGATGPVFRISGGRFIQLDSFTVFHNEGLAIHGLDRTRDVTLRELNLRAIGTAVLFTSAISLVIERCDIRSGLLPAALQTTTALDLRPLVYLAGLGLHVIENVLRADSVSARNRIALGGLQIAGGSREVRIRGNKILGGNGNGITLGSVTTRVDPGTGDSTGYQIPPWITIDADGCIQINPGGGVRPDPGSPPTVTVFSEGPVEDLHIRRNEIRDMGMSGISTAHWFIPIENNAIDVDDDMEIEDAVIASNWIENCMLLDLVAGLPPEIAFASAFGGIVLSGAINLQIEDNDIRECGTRGRTPICGIYVRYGEILHITGNRIYDNGRASTLSDLLLVGIIGGIVVSMVESGLETAAERHDFGAQPRAPAIFVKDNVVVSPEGRALDVRGTGPMLIEGNSLTCYGNNGLLILVLIFLIVASNPAVGAPLLASPLVQGQLQAIMGQLGGSAVLIHNLGVPQNLTLFGGGRKSTLAFTGNIRVIPAFPVATPRLPNLRGAVVGGEVQFSDNIVTFDALSNAATVSLCSVLIVSYDDVGMHDNQSTVELRGDVVLINTIAAGFLSARVQGNRFKETLPQRRGVTQPFPVTTFLSAMTFGLMNATENNQGTHCFLRLGLKKPRVMPNPDPTSDLVPIWLDTNRNFVPDQLCSALDELNYVIGARGRTS